jgi:hypothetical protein
MEQRTNDGYADARRLVEVTRRGMITRQKGHEHGGEVDDVSLTFSCFNFIVAWF